MASVGNIDLRLKQLNILVHIFTHQNDELEKDIYYVNDLDFKVTTTMATAFNNIVSTQKQKVIYTDYTPLMFAIDCKNNEAVSLLLNPPDNHDASHLIRATNATLADTGQFSVRNNLHPSIWKHIKEYLHNKPSLDKNLMNAVRYKNNVSMMERLIVLGANVNAYVKKPPTPPPPVDIYGMPIYLSTDILNQRAIAQFTVQTTPLNQAIWHKNLPGMKCLLQHKARIEFNVKGYWCSNLILAAQSEYLPMVIDLINHGADVTFIDHRGETAISQDCGRAIRQLLVNNGADPLDKLKYDKAWAFLERR